MLAQIDALHSTPASLETYAQVYGTSDANRQAVAADPEPFLALGIADAGRLEAAPFLVHSFLPGFAPLMLSYRGHSL
jgi:hypothetical protein